MNYELASWQGFSWKLTRSCAAWPLSTRQLVALSTYLMVEQCVTQTL